MLRFYRSMPRILMVEPKDMERFNRFMEEQPEFNFSFELDSQDDFDQHSQFDALSEYSILVYTVEKLTDESVEEGYMNAYVMEMDIETFMMRMLSCEEKLIHYIRQSPQMMVLKAVGDTDKILEKLRADLNGEIGDFNQMLKGKAKGSYVCLTDENVDHRLSFKDFHPKVVYTEMPFKSLKEHLAHYSLKYVNVGLQNQEWYELSVKIYDSYGRFKEQYDRLTYVIDLMNLGLIAGESWGRDTATVFLSVGIYKIKLVTFFKPEEIKRYLVGLEYDENGNRMVDMDLYCRKKKIHWDVLKSKEVFKKIPVGIEARKFLKSQMTDDEYQKLLDMEKDLKSS